MTGVLLIMNVQKLSETLSAAQTRPEVLDHLLETLVHGLLLYDNGLSITKEDFLARLEVTLNEHQLPAAASLYELAVQLCRRFSGEAEYETLQDCLGLQLDLWRAGILKLEDWLLWIEQGSKGTGSLPAYDFAQLMPSTRLPEGFMIQDFHDLLLDLLDSQPDMEWAQNERTKLYALLGVLPS